MKNIIYILLSLFVLTSCLKYGQPKLLSLSGEYVIDRVTYDNRDNQDQNQAYYPFDLYVNPSETKPLDSIRVGITKLALDYSVIYFEPTPNIDGITTWGKKYTYNVVGHNNLYEYGYIVFNYDGTRRVWKIIEDGVEHLLIRTSGSYDYGPNSSGESTTMYLTRVGP